jgi:polar amino acid transport system substrate-binding protein
LPNAHEQHLGLGKKLEKRAMQMGMIWRFGLAISAIIAFAVAFCRGESGFAPKISAADRTIEESVTLPRITARIYGNTSHWMAFYASQNRMSASVPLLMPGLSIQMPHAAGQHRPAQPPAIGVIPFAIALASSRSQSGGLELSPVVKRVEFLTADGYYPFTDRSQPDGGMMPRLVSAAMDLIKKRATGKFEYNISWVDDWAAHLNPLLVTGAFDAGFPWVKPDCSSPTSLSLDALNLCQRFLFSDPLYETFTVLFVKSSSPMKFSDDKDIVGVSLCQPAGLSTYELDQGGRNWVKDNKVLLLQPQSLEECFRLLDRGAVKAVVTSDLTGKFVAKALGISDHVTALPKPVSIGTLHVIVSKTHPQASTILYYTNWAIEKFREDGEYDRIVARHLSSFWNSHDEKW